jgi:hypothetical protein
MRTDGRTDGRTDEHDESNSRFSQFVVDEVALGHVFMPGLAFSLSVSSAPYSCSRLSLTLYNLII